MSDLDIILDNTTNKVQETIVTVKTDSMNAKVMTVNKENGLYYHMATAISLDNDFEKALTGENDAVMLLLKAVNNRTIERDYFKLYCELLDSSITEDEFDKIIQSNENEYIISELDKPSTKQLKIALRLADKIKGVNSINDFTSLFSFEYKELSKLLDNSKYEIHK